MKAAKLLVKKEGRKTRGLNLATSRLSHVNDEYLWRMQSTTSERCTSSPKLCIEDLLADLKACSKTRDLKRGQQVHAEAVESGHASNIYVGSALINMYAKCGSMVGARQVFDSMNRPNVVSWTTLILGYADNGEGFVALDMFRRMRSVGPTPNSVTLVAALKACTSLASKGGAHARAQCKLLGKDIHDFAVENGCDSEVYLQNALIDMYAKCGSMVEARQVFDRIQDPNVVSWTALIVGYVGNGQGLTGWNLFQRMKCVGPAPNSVTLVAALKSCTSIAIEEGPHGWLECRKRGKEIHQFAIETGCDSDIYLQNTLIDMYSKCGSIVEARRVFDSLKHPNVVSWNALIGRYAENGQGIAALDLFTKMRCGGPTPNSITLVAALKACSSLALKGANGCRERGKEIHDLAVQNGCASDLYLQNTLMDMYAKCGSMSHARQVFESMKDPNVVSWTALIAGYADNGDGLTALDLFRRMKNKGLDPNCVTVVAALKACTTVASKGGKWTECRNWGRKLHDLAVENGYDRDIYLQNTLIDMYSNCGSMEDALQVFQGMKSPNVVSWSALVLGYADNGQGGVALDMFTKMKNEGPAPNSVTLVAALKACTALALEGEAQECRNRGKELHDLAQEIGFDSDIYLQNTLIDMYAKCNSMSDARQVFNTMKQANVISWTALILGYADNGQGLAALDMFTRMKVEGPAPNCLTFMAVLKACTLVGGLEFGKRIHADIGEGDLTNVVLVNCLVDFYAKCGSMLEAQGLFDFHIKTRDTVTWNALLAGFSSCGHHEYVFGLFKKMQDAGFQPDSVTLLCILTCCNHGGLVDKGKECFDEMPTKYGIIAAFKHHNCMIDIFGRANKLNDAMALLQRMSWCPSEITWMTILGACRKWKNLVIGRLAFQSLINLNYTGAAAYVLMGQIYGSRGMLQEQEMVMRQLKARDTYG